MDFKQNKPTYGPIDCCGPIVDLASDILWNILHIFFFVKFIPEGVIKNFLQTMECRLYLNFQPFAVFQLDKTMVKPYIKIKQNHLSL